MEAPTCRICGNKHWSRLCNATPSRHVTFKPDVTLQDAPRNVTSKSVAPTKLAAAEAEIERLTAEVKALKRNADVALSEENDRLIAEVAHLKKLLADQHQKTVPVEERNRIAGYCPVCEARREADAKRVKKHRAKVRRHTV